MSLNPGIRKAMIFGAIIVIGGGAIAVSGLGWSILSSGTAEPRVLVGIVSSAYLAWIVTMLIKSR